MSGKKLSHYRIKKTLWTRKYEEKWMMQQAVEELLGTLNVYQSIA